MMPTDRGIGLAAGAGALWLASRVFGVPELQIAAVAALALLALAVVVVRLTSARLAVDRRVRPTRVFHDAEADVRLVVHNRSRLPTPRLELEDAAPAALASRGARMLLASMPPLASRVMSYRLRGYHRGRFVLGPLSARLRDPFGLVSRRVALPGTSELVVYPRVWRLSERVPLGGPSGGDRGRTRPLLSGEDLAHVREYVRGDDLRKVHWPSTAHRGRLMVRQPEAPRDPRATVLLDTRRQAHTGTGPASTFETAVSAAASVVHHVAVHGRAVRLVDGPGPATAPRPWQTHLAALADAQPRRWDLRPTLRGLATGGTGLLVAVVAAPTPAEVRELARAGRGFDPRLALLVAPAGPTPGGGDGVRAAGDALRIAGWRVTVLGPGDDIGERWRELLLEARRVPAETGR